MTKGSYSKPLAGRPSHLLRSRGTHTVEHDICASLGYIIETLSGPVYWCRIVIGLLGLFIALLSPKKNNASQMRFCPLCVTGTAESIIAQYSPHSAYLFYPRTLAYVHTENPSMIIGVLTMSGSDSYKRCWVKAAGNREGNREEEVRVLGDSWGRFDAAIVLEEGMHVAE